ncbi:hypothetical protein DPMN_054049 [Dreissena polymorpha]|uniref:Uncharacterized protein n=1 Tax=Dreissena polymorpha TaxID=45954 RepID=A0A9D4CN91_DREPO|nr:hypothetical protein DPMN_054049 [Dreissena polymorpha]
MTEKLPRRKLIVKHETSKKRRRVGKPWWNDGLTTLWNYVCESECKWLNCKSASDRALLKSDCRKRFDRAGQSAKR